MTLDYADNGLSERMRKYRGLVINGKFLAAKPTGVHRVAQQLLDELKKHSDTIATLFPKGMCVIAPRNGKKPVSDGNKLRVRSQSRLVGQAWEQIELPVHARGNLLLSLCNLAPIFANNAITMIHDAQVYTTPSSYSLPFRVWYKLVLPKIGRRSLQILTVSHFSAKQLVDFGVATADRITVIYNGVDHVEHFGRDEDVLAKLGIEHGLYVLALSNTQKHKNIAVLFKAFEKIEGVKLVLIGSAERRDFVVAGIDVGVDTIFAGKVSDEAMRSLMEGALCFAMPSLTEGFGLPPLEAMILGCPTLVAPCGALPEVCGDASLYADPHDPAAWAEGVTRIREDPTLRAQLIDAGRVQSARFTWEAAGRTLLKTLQRFAMTHAD